MDYKGIEFRLKMIEPGIWKYRFQIGRVVKTGRTKTTAELLPIRSVHTRIDRELKLHGWLPGVPLGHCGPRHRDDPDYPGNGNPAADDSAPLFRAAEAEPVQRQDRALDALVRGRGGDPGHDAIFVVMAKFATGL